LVVFNAVKANTAKPNIENAEPNLKPPANASIEVSPASKDGLITELRSALESLDSTPITEPDLQTSATAPQPEKANPAGDKQRSDLRRLLTRLEHDPAVDSELWSQLLGVIERLPASLKAQALVVFNAVKVNAAKPNIENAEPNLKPPANASIEVSPASKDGLITELRSALESLDPTPITEPDLQTSATAPQPEKANPAGDKLRSDLRRLLTRLEHDPAVDSELWTQLLGVIERLPASLKTQALVVFNAVKVNAAKPNIENAEQNLKTPANASIEVSPASKDGLITEIRSALESLDPTFITEPDLQTSATAPQPKKADPAGDKLRSDLRRLLARLEHDPAVDSELWTQLLGVIERLPASLKGTALGAFDLARGIAQKQPHNITTDKTEPTDHGPHAATKDRLIALLRSTVHQLPSPATIRPKTINQQETTNKQEIPINSSFSETDAIYVGNGGLVILWPFLQPFFDRLGLTHNKQFKDTSSAQRAVGLLQYLASGDESPLEFLLPLNKMLCGLAPESVFDFGVEISLEEKQECDDLLAAVIQQAPILKSMSIAGFRVSFLLRQGQLSSRDGQWLLRVERETHDIVLDRFPWGVSIIRLPWMTAIMQVEW
jgi:hypothetical protein